MKASVSFLTTSKRTPVEESIGVFSFWDTMSRIAYLVSTYPRNKKYPNGFGRISRRTVKCRSRPSRQITSQCGTQESGRVRRMILPPCRSQITIAPSKQFPGIMAIVVSGRLEVQSGYEKRELRITSSQLPFRWMHFMDWKSMHSERSSSRNCNPKQSDRTRAWKVNRSRDYKISACNCCVERLA
jgi:hypothetical protein